MKEKIFKALGSIPAESLYNYIQQGVVTYQELFSHGLTSYPSKLEYLKSKLSAGERSAWADAQQKNTVEGYDKYLTSFPAGEHAEEARGKLVELEDYFWRCIQQNISEQDLNTYIRIYPNGKYAVQCNELINDMPWLETKKRNTIEAYRSYSSKYPEKHTAEIKQAIDTIVDENDWSHATQINTTPAYKEYLEKHPNGFHSSDAKDRIANRSHKEIVLDNIRKDDNCYSAFDLQRLVENGTVSWADLTTVFSDAQIHAIQSWTHTPELPFSQPPMQLRENSTEIYFWGTRGTGKTCAMGAVLSYANRNGRLFALNCQHRVYLDQLSNLFSHGGDGSICNLPQSTQRDSISELNMYLIDDKKKKHKVTFIDLAGEMVTGIYKINNNIPLLDSEKATVNQILSYLKNPYNNKIHFFVLEYEKSHVEVPELSDLGYANVHQVDILTSIVEFLSKKGGLNKSTVGVYGLVTKSDNIDLYLGTSPDERPRLAHEYVVNNLQSFWNAINIACKDANVKGVKTISFSIGNVFAKNLCVFDGADSKKIVEQLLLKTKAEREGCLSWLFK